MRPPPESERIGNVGGGAVIDIDHVLRERAVEAVSGVEQDIDFGEGAQAGERGTGVCVGASEPRPEG